MFDIFYIGNKAPGISPNERQVTSIQEAQQLSRTRYCWVTNYLCDYSNWDFLYEPPPWEANFVHAWASQHQKDSGTYLVPKYINEGTKYHPDVIQRSLSMKSWENIVDMSFDYSWHPDPSEPPYIYQFGTQWQKTGGPRYVVQNATEVKYVTSPRATAKDIHPDNWSFPFDTGTVKFDLTWHPDDTERPYIYQFGTQWQKTGGPVYTVPGATEIKYVTEPRMIANKYDHTRWEVPDGVEYKDFDYTWHPDFHEEPYIYQFGTQWQKTGGPRYVVPGATQVKYVTEPRAIRTTVDDNWVAPTAGEFDDFDYTWHPDDTDDTPYIYQFGTQWQKTGGPQYIMLNATETKYVDQVKITAKKVAGIAIVIDFFDGNAKAVEEQLVKHGLTVVKTSRYYNDYLGTIRRVVRNVEADYVWIVSSICDYEDFDFSWHPEQWQAGMIHVFPSNEQKFGDTFFVNVQHFNDTTNRYELLEWHDAHFVENISVKRRTAPQIAHTSDSHVEVIQTNAFNGPVAVFTNNPQDMVIPTVNLWREETKQVIPLTPGGTTVVVPNVAVPYIKTQVYDYPEINKTHRHDYSDKPLDIVFISNGETVAEENWEHLLQATQHLPNRVYRVDGVKGRVNSFNAAWAQTSSEWVFHVTAKLQVNRAFNWNWQPDRLQQPKHYIFHAHNPVNGLEYGHMAMVAYNVKLGKQNDAHGLDFTTNQLHEVVPLMSGVANYASDPLVAWRTAFREVVKLKYAPSTPETDYRLEQWLSTDLVNNVCSAWSLQGARDAVEYYDSVQGQFEALRLTYEWEWLASYLLDKHGLTEQELIKKAP